MHIPKLSPQAARPKAISDLLQEELLMYLDSRPMAYLEEIV